MLWESCKLGGGEGRPESQKKRLCMNWFGGGDTKILHQAESVGGRGPSGHPERKWGGARQRGS